MTVFRGCIDIHNGVVKQIVGGTLKESDNPDLRTNFVSSHPPSYYANLYKENNVVGTHVIKLGGGCDEAAEEALRGWPRGLQIGGGINESNAIEWINKGADKVIVTSYLFPDGKFDLERLKRISKLVGKEHLVVDLSCRTVTSQDPDQPKKWVVAMNKWQVLTETVLNKTTLDLISEYCAEFLVHAADVEGLCRGIDEELVTALGKWCEIPVVYAGGAKSVEDLKRVQELSGGKVDLTYGSALDIFGGSLVKFEDVVEWNRKHSWGKIMTKV